ncbi:MAG: C1 family peptidase [Candidatus Wallbacteria bacterium]|nr:C1 family peptidase [Candidatus Wallbacteria bacterium]
MKKTIVIVSLAFSLGVSQALSLEGVSENRAVRFFHACAVAKQENATYRMSPEAMPAGVNFEDCCGLNLPEKVRCSILKLSGEPGNLPARFDWREQNGVSAVKSQGSAMCCWAFSLTGAFESQIMINEKTEVDLSEQDLISCNSNHYSCQGGFLDAAQYFQDKGVALEKDYPYAGHDAECVNTATRPYRISGWQIFDNNQETSPAPEKLKQAIEEYGPICCCMVTDDNFSFYKGGVYNHDAQGKINHAVILVGWDDSMGNGGCWILKNSHGTDWGDKGFMYIEYGKSRVGTMPTTITYSGAIASSSLDQNPEVDQM